MIWEWVINKETFSRAEKEPQDATLLDHTFLLGLCTGMFAACAIACTPTVSTLIPLAVQVVLMAFRTGAHVGSLAERLSPPVDRSEPWTYIFPTLTEADAKEALARFHVSNVSPLITSYPSKRRVLTSPGNSRRQPRIR